MSERDILLLIAVVLIGFISYKSLTKRADQSGATPSSQSATQEVEQIAPTSKSCGEIIERCTATASVTSKQCSEKSLKNEVASQLSAPLNAEGCKGISSKLSNSCPDECGFDYSNQLVIPGELTVKAITEPNDDGFCFAKGSRSITVRGSCVAAPSSQ